MRALDLTGEVYGRLTVLHRVPNKGKFTVWLCQCRCGNQCQVTTGHLRSGNTKSCGCGQQEGLRQDTGYRHGWYGTPTCITWKAMKQRCNYPNHRSYSFYGGRGIKVCERWDDFENFLADMGERPEGYSISRHDHDKDYCPENCSWAPENSH